MRNTVFCVKRGVLWGWFVNIFLSLKTVNAIFIISLKMNTNSSYANDSSVCAYVRIKMLYK